jgi:hypothetical protein
LRRRSPDHPLPDGSGAGGKTIDAGFQVSNQRLPVVAGDAFTRDDGPTYVWFQHEGCPAGTIVKSDWYFLGVDPPMHIGDATSTVGSVGNWGQFNLELARGGRSTSTGSRRTRARTRARVP